MTGREGDIAGTDLRSRSERRLDEMKFSALDEV